MSTFFSIVGGLVVGGLAIGFAAIGLAIAWDAVCRWSDKRDRRLFYEASVELGRRLKGDSWWFSEDVSAMFALQCVADCLVDTGSTNADRARSAWRAMMDKEREKVDGEQAVA